MDVHGNSQCLKLLSRENFHRRPRLRYMGLMLQIQIGIPRAAILGTIELNTFLDKYLVTGFTKVVTPSG